jgi:hypothetical protein
MADPTVPPTPPLRQTPKAIQDEYVALLLRMVATQQGISEDVARQVKAHAANQEPLPQSLIDIIKELCDCALLIAIIECLCKALTGG